MILVSEWMDDRGLGLLKEVPRAYTYEPEIWSDKSRLKDLLIDAEAWIVRNNTQVTPELLDAAPGLKVVGRLGVGLDNIDLDACQARRITVVYARGANAIPVVEYVIGALLHYMRPWVDWSHRTKQGTWQRRLGGHEVYGKTLGVVGLGDIGSRVARAARVLGMQVLVYDPHLAPFHALVADGTVSPAETLPALLGQSDAVTLHAPLRPDTYHLLDQHTLSGLKPGALLINTARGRLIDEAALLTLLEQGRMGGAYLDVRESEPPTLPDPLASFPEVRLTPHLAGLTDEALVRTTTLVLEDVMRVLTGRPARAPAR